MIGSGPHGRGHGQLRVHELTCSTGLVAFWRNRPDDRSCLGGRHTVRRGVHAPPTARRVRETADTSVIEAVSVSASAFAQTALSQRRSDHRRAGTARIEISDPDALLFREDRDELTRAASGPRGGTTLTGPSQCRTVVPVSSHATRMGALSPGERRRPSSTPKREARRTASAPAISAYDPAAMRTRPSFAATTGYHPVATASFSSAAASLDADTGPAVNEGRK